MTLFLLLTALLSATGAAQDPPLDMMAYQMVLLKKGPTAPPSAPAEQKKMQAEHLAGLAELNRKRINLVYGPVVAENKQGLEGIAVLDVPSAEAAKAHFAGDPLVKAGVMTVEVRPWMGPRGWFSAPSSYDVGNPSNLEPLIFGFLVRRPNAPAQDKATAEEIQKGHLAYMESLHKQGKLIMAGPFLDDADARGVVVYRVKDVAEAMALAAEDPAVKAGRLLLEAYPWMTFRGILK